jgi:hypothetical protein
LPHLGNVERTGVLGLIIWADAHCEARHQQAILAAVKPHLRPEKLAQMTTMELAWLLTGLSYAYQRSRFNQHDEGGIFKVYDALRENFNSASGLFHHRRTGIGATRFRNHIGNFADQIYSVYALSTFHQVFDSPTALALALQCAQRLVELQGSEGQWWWHYHGHNGGVVAGYPVFGVHQDGMAPMALFKLAAMSGRNFNFAIQRGLAWLLGENELRLPMIDWNRCLVWRAIELRGLRKYLHYVPGGWSAFPSKAFDGVYGFKLMAETRPYELGWLLYAFADQLSGSALPKDSPFGAQAPLPALSSPICPKES